MDFSRLKPGTIVYINVLNFGKDSDKINGRGALALQAIMVALSMPKTRTN